MAHTRTYSDEKFFGHPENFKDINNVMRMLRYHPALKSQVNSNGNNLLHYFASHDELCHLTETFAFLAFSSPELLNARNADGKAPLHLMSERFKDGVFVGSVLQQLLTNSASMFTSNKILMDWTYGLFKEYQYEICQTLLNENDSLQVRILNNFMENLLQEKKFKFMHEKLKSILFLREFQGIDKMAVSEKTQALSTLFEKLIKSQQNQFNVTLQSIVVAMLKPLVQSIDQTTPFLLSYLLIHHKLENDESTSFSSANSTISEDLRQLTGGTVLSVEMRINQLLLSRLNVFKSNHSKSPLLVKFDQLIGSLTSSADTSDDESSDLVESPDLTDNSSRSEMIFRSSMLNSGYSSQCSSRNDSDEALKAEISYRDARSENKVPVKPLKAPTQMKLLSKSSDDSVADSESSHDQSIALCDSPRNQLNIRAIGHSPLQDYFSQQLTLFMPAPKAPSTPAFRVTPIAASSKREKSV